MADPLLVAYVCTKVILAILIVFVNGLVLVTICKFKRLHVPHNIFVSSMVIADGAVGLISVPIRLFVSQNFELGFQTCLHLNTFSMMLIDLAILMIFGLTMDRLFAVSYPFRYRNFRCKHAVICCGFLWIFGVACALLPYYLLDDDFEQNYKGVCHFSAVISVSYLFYVRAIGFCIIPVMLILMVNIYILKKMHKQSVASLGNSSLFGKPLMKDKEIRPQYILIIMIATFVICMLPLNVIDAVWYISGVQPSQHSHFVRVGKLLYKLHSLVDPFVYGLAHGKIRRAAMILTRMKCMETEEASVTVRYVARSLASIKSGKAKFQDNNSTNNKTKRTIIPDILNFQTVHKRNSKGDSKIEQGDETEFSVASKSVINEPKKPKSSTPLAIIVSASKVSSQSCSQSIVLSAPRLDE